MAVTRACQPAEKGMRTRRSNVRHPVLPGATATSSMHIQALSISDSDLESAGAALREGRLVAFPTETVYGLGAAITRDDALLQIFVVKGRPFHDPLIVHGTSFEMLQPFLALSPSERVLFETLSAAFWPGPLTLVVPASERLSKWVTGGGSTVGVRFPAHPVARKLISLAGVPIAAPSANRFGHVSPTCARHVEEDLGSADILLVDGGDCEVGIESTVAKICEEGRVEILRPGVVTEEALRSVLEPMGVSVAMARRQYATGTATQEAPGQLLRHYAPHVGAYLLTTASEPLEPMSEIAALNQAAVVDFGARHSAHAADAAVYLDLSVQADFPEACRSVFGILRRLESHPEVRIILLPDLSSETDGLSKGLSDRIERACSRKRARVVGRSVLAEA